MLKLYAFNLSHFSEKARWTLDYEGISYEERVLLPGPHQLVTRRIARRTHVPVLEHDGQYVQGSSAIIDYVADRLGGTKLTAIDPAERAKALKLENTLDQVFGRGVQQVLYSAFLKDRRTVIDLWSFGGPFWASGFYAVAFPAIASAVKRMYKTTDVEGVAKAKQRFVTTFDELDAVLAKQPYLGGVAPDRTDITLAALLAPVCRVPEHRMKWPAMPRELADLEASLSGRPTWNHVSRMYRDHRKRNHSHVGAHSRTIEKIVLKQRIDTERFSAARRLALRNQSFDRRAGAAFDRPGNSPGSSGDGRRRLGSIQLPMAPVR